MQRSIILFILIMIFSNPLLSRDLTRGDSAESEYNYWLGLGIGGNYFGPHLCANLSFTIDEHLFTIKYGKSNEFHFAGVENNYDDPQLEIREYGFLYGRFHRENILLLSLSAGISYIKGINRGKNIQYHDFEKINISTVGIPFEAEAMFEITNYAGIGLLFYGNINKDKIYKGIMFRIKAGWF